MAFVPDAELSNFVDSLDVKVESENLREEKSLSDTGCRDENKEDDVWEIIANAADDWSRRLVDAECLHKRSIDFRTNVENRCIDNNLMVSYRIVIQLSCGT